MTDRVLPADEADIPIICGKVFDPNAPVLIYPRALQCGLSDADIGAMVRMEFLLERQKIVQDDVIIEKAFDGDAERAHRVIQALTDVGLLADAATVQEEEQRQLSEPSPEHEPLRAPSPWPTYTGTGWSGDRYIPNRSVCPPRDQPVVYMLNRGDELLYVGVTKDLYTRLKGHIDKPWDRWSARPCATRDDALWIEAEEIRRWSPPLNRDRDCGGRARLVPADLLRRRPRAVTA